MAISSIVSIHKLATTGLTGLPMAVLPYIDGISQPLTRLLKKHDVRVVSKPFKTLQQEFPSPKSRPLIDLQPYVVYKIPCADCPWNYVGETGRCFETRKKEHMRECFSLEVLISLNTLGLQIILLTLKIPK